MALFLIGPLEVDEDDDGDIDGKETFTMLCEDLLTLS